MATRKDDPASEAATRWRPLLTRRIIRLRASAISEHRLASHWKSDARCSFSANSPANAARRGRHGSRHRVWDSYGIDGGSHRRESYAAGSGVVRSDTEELPPLDTVAQDRATLYAGGGSTSGIHSGLSSAASLAVWHAGLASSDC